MTEAQWLSSRYPQSMIRVVADRGMDRKLRLFACACCRRIWDKLTEERSRTAVECAERFADGLAGPNDLRTSLGAARRAFLDLKRHDSDSPDLFTLMAAADTVYGSAWDAAMSAAVDASWLAGSAECMSAAEGAVQAVLLRDLFGNPFRPASFDPRWRTTDVRALAAAIYDDRAFDRLPLLADALMDAGCEDEQVIAHCRSPGPHARGCWVVDLALGKE